MLRAHPTRFSNLTHFLRKAQQQPVVLQVALGSLPAWRRLGELLGS